MPPDRRAAVEAWLAAHAEDAARVAAWRAQADAIRTRYGAVATEPVPARFDLDKIERGERKWSRLAAAARAGARGRGGRRLVRTRRVGGRAARQGCDREALDAHKLYVVEVRHPVEVPGIGKDHLGQWLSRRVGYSLSAPNLEPIGLKLVGGRLLPSLAGTAAAFFMYEGASGERFTIYCRRAQAPESALRYRAAGTVGTFSWVADDVGFVVSGPADRARLQKVAEAAYGQLETKAKTGALPASRVAGR